ncbi:MAG: Mur ligase family protein [Planctomycetota bacterium]|nr:Mur ligase family protein [Planctomycetota bacterium]MDA1180252.1 Mur ligase family protein [Planctomycetota bacterium]
MLSTQPLSRVGLQLSDVLPQARPLGAGDASFQACSTHADSVRPGDLFIAVDLSDHDGHHDALLAERRGASAFVTERVLPVRTPQFLVDDSRSALAHIGHALAGHPSRQMQVVGVLDGIHTVTPTVLISAALERSGFTTGLANELGACDGYETTAAVTPVGSALSFARWLAESQANQATHAVVGITPSVVVSRSMEATHFSHIVLTGLRPDRGIGYASPRRAAEMLLSQLDPHGLLIYNRDDLLCREIAQNTSVPSVSFGLHGEADVRGEIVEKHRGEQTLLVEGIGDFAALRTRPFGGRHASFCLAASAVGLTLGIEFSQICSAIERVDRLPLALEPVCGGQSFGIYLDSAWDPWSVRQCIKSFQGTTSGRLITVTAGSAQLSVQEHAVLGRTVEVGSHLQVLCADPQNEPGGRLKSIHQILDGFQDPSTAAVCPDRSKAVEYALNSARPDDVVLITGCRGEIGKQTTRKTDRHIIDQWLKRDLSQSAASLPSNS